MPRMPVIISESFAHRHQSNWWDWTAPRHGKSAVLAVFNGLNVQPINCIGWRLESRRTHRGSDRIGLSHEIHILCLQIRALSPLDTFESTPKFLCGMPSFFAPSSAVSELQSTWRTEHLHRPGRTFEKCYSWPHMISFASPASERYFWVKSV